MFQVDVLKQVTQGFAPGTKVCNVVTLFAETMLEAVLLRYSLYPAKGTTIAHFAHNSDQMMVTHILNGLFPVLTIVAEAQERNVRRLSRLTEEELKVYILAYLTHDIDKILGEQLKTLTAKGTAEARQKLLGELEKLNAQAFLPTVENWANEILWLAVNTQRSRDINLSHNTFVTEATTRIYDEVLQACYTQASHFHTRTRIESTLRDLCTLSDLIAFLVKSPEDVLLSDIAMRKSGLIDILRQLTDNGSGDHFMLYYHKLDEVRGLLANQINNATMRYVKSLYPKDQEPLLPFLYFPNGVVYLDPLLRPAPAIAQEKLHEVVIEEIQEACSGIVEDGDALAFNHLGLLKYPRYFHDFLRVEGFLALFVKNTLKEKKANVAENTLQKMREMQIAGAIPAHVPLDYTPSSRVSMLGRFLINYLNIINENLGKTAPQLKLELENYLIGQLGEDIWNEAQQIPSSGGVDYRFYWLAAQYLKTHPLAPNENDSPGESLEGLFNELTHKMIQLAGQELTLAPDFQGPYLRDLPDYLKKNLTFGFSTTSHVEAFPDFSAELSGYSSAKKQRGSQLTCTICNSAYPTQQQEDASVLFQPWVYKNRLSLYKSENAGGICSICSLELMLRQILLTDKLEGQGRIKVTGKSYEDMELKYFFLYPGFFFTNQTYRLTSYIIRRRMKNLKLYEVCEVLRERDQICTSDFFNLSFFNLNQADHRSLANKEMEKKEEIEDKGSMYLFDRYEERQYPGFIFFAKKTFSKKKASGETTKATTTSWVEAAWLGLAIPLITGARVVVTETYLPLYNSAVEFLETVVLDAPHQAIRHLLTTPSARLRLDELYGRRKPGEDETIGGVMAALSRAIELHIDTERSGGDLKLERFARITRDLETDQLFVFAFLKEQLRRDKLEGIPAKKARHYNDIYYQFIQYYHAYKGDDFMTKEATRHERITDLYLQFYLPFNEKGWPSSHAIVRPIEVAAKAILKDTLNLTEDEIKLEMIHALKSWLDIVHKGGATGKAIKGGKEEDRLVRQFVETFYKEVFQGYAEGERSVLNSRLNRFKGGCEIAFSQRYTARRDSPTQATEEAPVEEIPATNGVN
jgi:CRISPR-associated protein Csc3